MVSLQADDVSSAVDALEQLRRLCEGQMGCYRGKGMSDVDRQVFHELVVMWKEARRVVAALKAGLAAERLNIAKRGKPMLEIRCANCGCWVEALRSDKLYCSQSCGNKVRKKAKVQIACR